MELVYTIGDDMEQVKKWFEINKREFPWREKKDPYRVLISEIMLQQTRASVVVPYFVRWLERFPTIWELSQASEAEVIKLWEGLGYYSRARNLLKLAKRVVLEYKGQIPDSREDLIKLEGLGEYTVGAILSFGFHQKAVALDGNVTRVMARWLGFDKCARKHAAELRASVYQHLPNQKAHVVMEGLIELGAEVCKKKPLCHVCPLRDTCLARKQGMEEVLPILPLRKPVQEIFRAVGCIAYDNEYLVRQVPKGEIMEGLFEFPYVACEKNPPTYQKAFEAFSKSTLSFVSPLVWEKHHFTQFKCNLYPFHFIAKEKNLIPYYQWVAKEKLSLLPFSSGHKKIFRQLIA